MLLRYGSSNLVVCVLVSWGGSTRESGYSGAFCKQCTTINVNDISTIGGHVLA